ncbi:MAG: hypothetical protein FJY67_07965 [Calditrichaeota bacterium]|nr:hypothetical protein [Calditrichota bacterium]
MNTYWDNLNPAQQEAVLHADGPLLILAGAGSGKTRVLACRTAELIRSGRARPDQILALTFTNKAAGELRSRTIAMAGPAGEYVVAGTFHSIFARILRQEGRSIGIDPRFTIIDADDRKRLLKEILKSEGIPIDVLKPNYLDAIIGRAKNNLITPEEFNAKAEREFEHLAANLYRLYQERLERMAGLDFDDLLMRPVLAYHAYPDFLERLQRRFHFVMVDEFQDTNPVQYRLVREIARRHNNLGVVGDDDQAIYGWRGATVANILDFRHDWPSAKVVRLEQNYRSHKAILDIAWSVIQRNPLRHEKRLWTERLTGPGTILIEGYTDDDEAQKFVSFVQGDVRTHKRSLDHFAILYRTNAQSLAFERALRGAAVPYQVVGGLRFYERREVKDLLAYLRLIVNPSDDVSFQRVINYPPRGIGESVVSQVNNLAQVEGVPYFRAMEDLLVTEQITSRQKKALTDFRQLIDELRIAAGREPLLTLVTTLVERIRLKERLMEEEKEDPSRSESKVANLLALIDEIGRYSEEHPDGSMEGFLEQVALVTDIDRYEESSGRVSLMTIHSAKGLEFPVVLVGGLEEGLLPLAASGDSSSDIDEERRLFYVAVTRAIDQLVLGCAYHRVRWGESGFAAGPSRFLKEIPPELIKVRRAYAATTAPLPRSAARSGTPDHRPSEAHTGLAPDDLRKGLLVKHHRFGIGLILDFRRQGLDSRIEVEFESEGRKTLILRYARLERA